MATRLSPQDYATLQRQVLHGAAVLYLNGHDYTVDGFMAIVDRIDAELKGAPLHDVTVDTLVRYGDVSRQAALLSHDKMVAEGKCPVC